MLEDLGAALGNYGVYAIVEVARAGTAVLKKLDPELCLLSAEELERSIHR